jgi:ribokinase
MLHKHPFEVVVVGSLNMDLVVRVERFPQAGETISGQSFATFLGGKGYNQALAAARAGSRVAMVGKLGQDSFGDQFIEALKESGMDNHHVTRVEGVATGIANIVVEPDGTNRIIVVPGANGTLSAAAVEAAAAVFHGAKILLLQLETPLDSAIAAARLARTAGAKVLLTPAPVPAQPLPAELLKEVDILIPNEVEVFQLAGMSPGATSGGELPEAAPARYLLEQGVQAVLVTLGGRGAAYFTHGKDPHHSPGFEVEVVDTTAAGDAFTGALATALAKGESIEQAIRQANASGALATTRPGSGESLPTVQEISAFLSSYL